MGVVACGDESPSRLVGTGYVYGSIVRGDHAIGSGAWDNRVKDGPARVETVVTAVQTANDALSDTNRQAKYCKMVASPFSFYRGSNHLFWADLSDDSRLARFGNNKTRTWIQGDLHAENFGSFADDEGEVVYDLNDFDESIIADYQFDIWRMAISLLLVSRQNGGFGQAQQAEIVSAFSEAYLDAMADFKGNDGEGRYAATANNTDNPIAAFLARVERKKTRKKLLRKWTTTTVTGLGRARWLDTNLEKLGDVAVEEHRRISDSLRGYGLTMGGDLAFRPDYFVVKSIAKRLFAGTGSLGTSRFYVLIEGPSESVKDDVILDIKRQSTPTAIATFQSQSQRDYHLLFSNEGERHALAYRALGKDVDDHLGWIALHDGHYSVRELSPRKDTLDTASLTEITEFLAVAAIWGKVLAAAHARADKDFDSALVAYSIDKQIAKVTSDHVQDFLNHTIDVATQYAAQVQVDYAIFSHWLGGNACAPVN